MRRFRRHLDERYEAGLRHAERGIPANTGTLGDGASRKDERFSRMAYMAGWHDGHRQRVGICGAAAPQLAGGVPMWCELLADHRGWHRHGETSWSGSRVEDTQGSGCGAENEAEEGA